MKKLEIFRIKLLIVEMLSAQSSNIQEFIYLPSAPTAQDGIIDLIISPSAGTAPYTVKYYKKQQNDGHFLNKVDLDIFMPKVKFTNAQWQSAIADYLINTLQRPDLKGKIRIFAYEIQNQI